MPVTWEIRGQILIVTLAGDYGFDEPVHAVTEALADTQFRSGTSLLVDARLSHARRSSFLKRIGRSMRRITNAQSSPAQSALRDYETVSRSLRVG
jgi:hypothetical protein